jgi:hypothetical protein
VERLDVLMLGRSIQRILNRAIRQHWVPSNTVTSQAVEQVQGLLRGTLCEPAHRLSLEDVGDLLWALEDTYNSSS